MHNVESRVEGNKLIITVDLSVAALKAAQPSASGKSRVVGTTGGFRTVDGIRTMVSFALNVTVKP